VKKFINVPVDFVDEFLQGILSAHPDSLGCVDNDLRCIVRKQGKSVKKVALATGGGSGHLPLFLGYVGEGMLDGCSVGGVFQSPSSEQMLKVTKAIDSGMGVLYIYGNYSGDIINFDMAKEMAELEGIHVEQVLGMDDVASAPRNEETKRRGVAGIFYIYKIAGALANEGATLEKVKLLAEHVKANVRTMGVALSPCIIPEMGKPTFTLGEDEMEIGMGIHGEPGIRREKLKTADEVVEVMMQRILEDIELSKGNEVSVLVNGLGATPKEELYLVYRRINDLVNAKGLKVFHVYIGEFATSMEMAGFSISILKLDVELKRLLAKPADTPFFKQFQL
jgi:dihydroxyacetone kinase-like protein